MRSDHKLQKPPYLQKQNMHVQKAKRETKIMKQRYKRIERNKTIEPPQHRFTWSNRFKSGKNDNFSYDDLLQEICKRCKHMRNKSQKFELFEGKTFVVFKELDTLPAASRSLPFHTSSCIHKKDQHHSHVHIFSRNINIH